MSFSLPASGVGRFTAIVLGFVVFVCVAMIGGTGYLKYQLDRAETVLAAPDSTLGGDQDVFERLRRDWSYGGFLGLAQSYVASHNNAGYAEMKEHIKSADAIIAHLPDKTSADTRRELTAIAAVFDRTAQKIGGTAGDGNGDFAASDLAPLYAALPILDARITASKAEARLSAQNQMQFWGMLLTLVSWCSLIIAAACAAGIYLTLRDKHAAPMRALAQSIQNMSRGDMRTAIWGIERQDMIGELARAVDTARYHFSHLPDLSLVSDQGPVRMRFEGETRSLFEAMMKAISRDSETIRQQSSSLTDTVKAQQEAITDLSGKVGTVLQNILQRGQTGDQQVKQAIAEMLKSAEGMKNAHAHAADQLDRLIPHIQDRAQGLAEITHITGKQISQTLQSLTASEISMKTQAEQAKETLLKLSSTADNLSERLFGAINLLQAGGKVLSETAENVKSRLGVSAEPLPLSETALAPWMERFEQITGQLAVLQNKLDAQADVPVQATMSEDVFAPLCGQVEQISGQLAVLQEKLEEQARGQSSLVSALEQNMQPKGTEQENPLAPLSGQVEKIAGQLAALQEKMDAQSSAQSGLADVLVQNLQQSSTEQATVISGAVSELNEKLAALGTSLPTELRQSLQEDLQRLAAQVDLAALGEKIAALQAEINKEQALSPSLTQRLNDIGQELAAKVESTRSGIDRTLRLDVGSKLAELEQTLSSTQRAVETTQSEIMKPMPAPVLTLPPELQQMLLDQWVQMSAQIEASRASLVDAVSNQIDKMESRLGKATNVPSTTAADYALQRHIEQQTDLLTELVATMGVLDAHMQQIKAEVHTPAQN